MLEKNEKKYSLPDEIKTYKQLVEYISGQKNRQLIQTRNMVTAGFISMLVAVAVIIIYCFLHNSFEICLGTFCTTSLLATIATALYLIFKNDEIDERYADFFKKLEKGMNPDDVNNEFLRKLAEEHADSMLKEVAKNPFAK